MAPEIPPLVRVKELKCEWLVEGLFCAVLLQAAAGCVVCSCSAVAV